MIETVISWILGIISNCIGKKRSQKVEKKQKRENIKREIAKEVKSDLLACIEEGTEQFKDFEKLRKRGYESNCKEFIELCDKYMNEHFYHTACYKKLEMDIPESGELHELLKIVKMEKSCLDISNKNFMSDIYFETLDEFKKNNILKELQTMSFEYSNLYSKYDSNYLKKILDEYSNLEL